MEPGKLAGRILSIFFVGALATVGAGCALMEKCSCLAPQLAHQPPVSRVDMMFQPFVHVVDDTVNAGGQIPGLAGRVWLFSEDEGKTVPARGAIHAELFDMSAANSGAKAEKIVDWEFKSDVLKRLKQEDKIGLGYTLFLPWMEYRPDIKKVQLRLTYLDDSGARHVTTSTLNLRSPDEAPKVRFEEYKSVPATNLTQRK